MWIDLEHYRIATEDYVASCDTPPPLAEMLTLLRERRMGLPSADEFDRHRAEIERVVAEVLDLARSYIRHRWLPEEIAETIDIYLTSSPGSGERAQAEAALAARVNAGSSDNPIRLEVIPVAVKAVANAVNGDYARYPRPSQELRRQVEARRTQNRLDRSW